MYASLQACRAAAALMVVLFHLGGTFAQPRYFGNTAFDGLFAWGDAGVDFFFVLSGFLITTVHRDDFSRPRALPRYLFKRVVRIYPTYWIVCAAVCLSALAVPALRDALPSDPLVYAKALALWPQDPDVVGGTGSPILFVAWSLQYELMFYAVIAAFIVGRGVGVVVAAALLMVNLGCQLGTRCGFPASFVGNSMVFLFAMGVGAAALARSAWRLPKPAVVAALAALAFVGFGALELQIGREALPIDRRLVYGAIASLLIVALVRAEQAGTLVPKQRWLAVLGDASYALYLLHIPVISVLCKVFARLGVSGPLALTAVFAFVVLACIGVAVLFHLAIERPMLARLRFGRREPSRPAAAFTGAVTMPRP